MRATGLESLVKGKTMVLKILSVAAEQRRFWCWESFHLCLRWWWRAADGVLGALGGVVGGAR